MYKKRECRYEWDVLYMKCVECWKRWTIDDFYKDCTNSYWCKAYCRECWRARKKKFYWENRERENARGKEYRMNNREKETARCRMYRQTHREVVNNLAMKYRIANREKNKEYQKQYRRHRSSSLWFNWGSFHELANSFAKNEWLKPTVCSICWAVEPIVMHHPSYESFEKWSEVVFCCQSCHKLIHAWTIACPEPINLLELS